MLKFGRLQKAQFLRILRIILYFTNLTSVKINVKKKESNNSLKNDVHRKTNRCTTVEFPSTISSAYSGLSERWT